jgi:hypothetical protein
MSSPSNAFHLRPVSEKRHSTSMSDSPTASSSGSSPTAEKDNMRTFREGDSSVVLRDLDLDNTLRGKFPNLPAPPSGHDLMKMFPPPAPSVSSMPHNRREATSGYFHLQERAYFAQAGKEIIRVRVDVDVRDVTMNVDERNHDADKRRSRGMEIDGGRRRDEETRLPGPSASIHPQVSPHLSTIRSPREHREDGEHVPSRDLHPKHSMPSLRRMSIESMHPHSPPKSRYAYPPDNKHEPRELRLAPSEYMSPSSTVYSHPDESDESWRQPMPYGERRRAGKHTRRVIVKT